MRIASLQPNATRNDMAKPTAALNASLAPIFKAALSPNPDVLRKLIPNSLPANKPKNTQVVLIGIWSEV